MRDHIQRYSKVYKIHGKNFIYDNQDCVVHYVLNVPPDEFSKPSEYIRNKWWIADTVGLRRENWQNKDRRDEYLGSYCSDLDEEMACMMSML